MAGKWKSRFHTALQTTFSPVSIQRCPLGRCAMDLQYERVIQCLQQSLERGSIKGLELPRRHAMTRDHGVGKTIMEWKDLTWSQSASVVPFAIAPDAPSPSRSSSSQNNSAHSLHLCTLGFLEEEAEQVGHHGSS